MRLLYVDDHEKFRALVAAQFLSAHEVTFATTLAQARELLATNIFDGVLLDHDLPDGAGTELVEELKARDLLRRTVAVSSFDEKNARLLRAGVVAAVGKMKFADIASVLERL